MSIRTIRQILNGRIFPAISPDASLEAASDLMLARRVSAVPVLENGNLVGVLSERDILRHVSQRGGYATARVAEAMTREVVSVETRGSIVDAAMRMQAGGFRQMPVIDIAGKVVGVLSMDDIPAELKTSGTRSVAWRGAMAAS